jgi:hypothetical protein
MDDLEKIGLCIEQTDDMLRLLKASMDDAPEKDKKKWQRRIDEGLDNRLMLMKVRDGEGD